MSEMVRKVARALAQRFIDRGNARIQGSCYDNVDDMPESMMRDFRKDARTALEVVLASRHPDLRAALTAALDQPE